ncbi:uncharacterized protein LOC132927673 [Rhopalosiphum padi]|uniref:uncharacterized protein LOC132927673 n=1 Tax=Rhopalosiphum padi TaxID=40932 RepID=UPI00298DDE5F|nr:uncharacterized protein LOC132927673 [Rhopalosiphum padi]
MKTFKTGFSKSLPHPTLHADDGNNGNLGANLQMCQTKLSRGQKSKRRRRHRRKTKAVTIAAAAVAAASAAAEKAPEVATVPTDPECPNVIFNEVAIEAKTSEPRPDGGNTGIPDGPDAADVGSKVRRRKASGSRLKPSRLRRIAARAAARAVATSSPKTKEPDPENIN